MGGGKRRARARSPASGEPRNGTEGCTYRARPRARARAPLHLHTHTSLGERKFHDDKVEKKGGEEGGELGVSEILRIGARPRK
jgi:hypothetical protein